MTAVLAVACGLGAAGLLALPRRPPRLPVGVRRLRAGVPLDQPEDGDRPDPSGGDPALPRRAVVMAILALGAAAILSVGAVRGAVVAVVAAPAVVLGARALARRPAALPADRSLALVLDLWAAALRAGQTVPAALAAAAPAARHPATRAALERAAGLLAL